MATLDEKVNRLEVDAEVIKADQKSIREDQREMKKDIKELLALANQTKGGWKTIMLIGGMSGAVGALLGKFLPFMK